MARFGVDSAMDVKSLGFSVNCGLPGVMRSPHAHTDIEGNFLLSGSLSYLHGGRTYTIRPGRLTLFWAGIPHRLTEVQERSQIIWLVLPLAWYMQWQLPEAVTQKLLCGQMVWGGGRGTDSAMDEMLLSRWVSDLSKTDVDTRRIVMLEVEARVRRLVREVAGERSQRPSADDATGSHAERLAAYMARHYREELSVKMITESTGLHSNYAMQLFKNCAGMGMWEYLMQLRISHAQRLLLTSDWKVCRIALESGFASPSRFYEAFVRISGCTPGKYRRKGMGSSDL